MAKDGQRALDRGAAYAWPRCDVAASRSPFQALMRDAVIPASGVSAPKNAFRPARWRVSWWGASCAPSPSSSGCTPRRRSSLPQRRRAGPAGFGFASSVRYASRASLASVFVAQPDFLTWWPLTAMVKPQASSKSLSVRRASTVMLTLVLT